MYPRLASCWPHAAQPSAAACVVRYTPRAASCSTHGLKSANNPEPRVTGTSAAARDRAGARVSPAAVRARGQWLALGIAAAVWLPVLALILAHRLFVTNDSLSTYAHVWYIHQQLAEH